MRKSIKCGIAAAVVMAAGFAAYQTYGAYGAQDNTLLTQNIEALAGNANGEGDAGGEGGGVKPKQLEQCLKGGTEFFPSDRVPKCPKDAWTPGEYKAYLAGTNPNIYQIGHEPECSSVTTGTAHTILNYFYCLKKK